jgi:hypothetical protein
MSTDWQSFELAQRASSVLIATGYGLATLVIAKFVRRQRPDAWHGLLGWGVAGVVLTLGDMFLTRAISTAASEEDAARAVRMLSVYFVVYAFAHLALTLFLARCLVKLAQPAKPVEVEGSPPYR